MLVDINCDMGESYGRFQLGNDAAILPLVSSCNIACGFHGGDPKTIENTIQQAIKLKKRIGAHPSYPDLSGFGRRSMRIPKAELTALLRYQIAALKGLCAIHDGELSYVKPHGALYNDAAQDENVAEAVLAAVGSFAGLALMGLAGSVLEKAAIRLGFPFLAEAFADRRYLPDGQLVSRQEADAVIQAPQQAVEQVLNILLNQQVQAKDGTWIAIKADTFCIHGDNPAAIDLLQALRRAFRQNGLAIQ